MILWEGMDQPRPGRHRPCRSPMTWTAAPLRVRSRFRLDGTEYQTSLNAEHARQLRDALAAHVRAGRRVLCPRMPMRCPVCR